MSQFCANKELTGTVKSVFTQALILKMIVLSAHTGTGSSVQVIQTHALQEPNGLETSARLSTRNASQACTGLEALALLSHPNAPPNSSGLNNKTDASHPIMFVQAELISTDTHACHTADARTAKSGATLLCNASALITHSGMVQVAFHVSVVCYSVLLDATAPWELSSTELPAAKFYQKTAQPFHSVSSMAKNVTAFQDLTRLTVYVSVPVS